MAETPDFLTLKHNRDGAGRREAPIRRTENIPLLSEVRWAVLETNGQISFITKE